MSTIVTRKSLALGAIVALATTVFAGAPAHAANEINLVPSAGTSLSTLSTETFALESSFAPGVANGNAQLYFQIKSSVANVDASVDSTDAAARGNGAHSVLIAPLATGDASDAAAYVGYVRAYGTTPTDQNFVAVSLNGATSVDSADVTVTAFVDANNDRKLTAGEWATAKTVSFKKYSAVTATVALEDPKEGDTSAVGHLTLAGLNLNQIQSDVVLSFGKNSTDALDGAGGAAAKNPGITAASTDAGDYKATTGTVDAFVSTDTVEVSATVGGEKVGTAVKKTATARTISDISATVDTADNSLATSAGNGKARTNSSFTVTALALTAAATPVAAASVDLTVEVTVTAAGGWTTDAADKNSSVTVNGVKYDTAAKLAAATITAKTGANGKAVVTVVPANFANGDTFAVKFSAQHLDDTATATLEDAEYTVSDDAAVAIRKIVKNGSTVINYSVKDQYGVLAAASNQRLHITTTNASTAAQFPAVVGGKVAVTVTASKDTTDAIVVHGVLEAKAISSTEEVTWSAVSVGTALADITINVSDVADDFDTVPFLAQVNGSATTVDALEELDHDAFDKDHVVTGSRFAEIQASVKVEGSTVTVSGAGLAFVIGGKLYTDSVTVPVASQNGLGDLTVLVASHKSGVQTVSFKTGAVTKTVDVTFATATVHYLKNTVVSAPSQAQAGRSVTVSATLTDAFGNVVVGKLVKFAVDGVGTLSSSDAVTDSKGVASVRLTSSYGEDGDATVTVSHNGSDDATDSASATDKNDFTVVKTVTFGITDASIDNVGKRVTAVASYSKGKTVGFYVDGVKKWSKVSTTDADVVVNYNLKKGRHTVTVKISGGLVTSEVIIVQ